MPIQRASNSIYNKLYPPLNLVDHVKSRYSFNSLSSDVRSAVEKVSSSRLINDPKEKALLVDPSYQITHLSKHSLAQLHEVISSYLDRQNKDSPFFIHLFDIEDQIFDNAIVCL